MLNRLQKRLTLIAFFIGLNMVLGTYFLSIIKYAIPEPIVDFFSRLGISPSAYTIVQKSVTNEVEKPDLDISKIAAEINRYRLENGVEPVILNPGLSKAAQILLDNAASKDFKTTDDDESIDLEAALKASGYNYEWVSHNALIGPLNARGAMNAWLSDRNESELLLNEEFADVGLATMIVDDPDNGQVGAIVQLLGKPSQNNPPDNSLASSNQASGQVPSIREIPDTEVIDALNSYRSSHQLYAYNVDQNLCTYADKRAQDLETFGGLDGHAGFRSDFSDPENPPVGISDYPRGRKIGENLAHQFCKNMTTGESFVAETGTALIEWCFDSSTKGHREAQLSREFKNVCVRHRDNMYVVIFGE